MPELEDRIAEWRRQLVAGGINTPAVLDELESHLREDVDGRLRSGSGLAEAFEAAVQGIGPVRTLQSEFTKARGWSGFWLDHQPSKSDRILAVIWLVGCAWSFNTMCGRLTASHPPGASPGTALLLMNVLITFIYAAGLLGSIFLFSGLKPGRSIVRMLALLLLIACVAQIFNFRMPAGWRLWCGLWALFSLVSIGRLPSRPNLKPDSTPATT